MFKRLGVVDGLPVDDGARRRFGELPALVRGMLATGSALAGTWRGEAWRRRVCLIRAGFISAACSRPARACLSRQAGAATLIESGLP